MNTILKNSFLLMGLCVMISATKLTPSSGVDWQQAEVAPEGDWQKAEEGVNPEKRERAQEEKRERAQEEEREKRKRAQEEREKRKRAQEEKRERAQKERGIQQYPGKGQTLYVLNDVIIRTEGGTYHSAPGQRPIGQKYSEYRKQLEQKE